MEKDCVLRNGMLLAIVLLTSMAPVQGVDISSCVEINSSGKYSLTGNILNNNSAVCINITASDVIFDGQGFIIDGVDSGVTTGISVYNSTAALTNVTITNVTVSDWDYGIQFNNVQNSNMTDVLVVSNNVGIYLASSNGNNLSKVNSSGNTIGISVYNSATNKISDNNISSNLNYGLYLSSANSNKILNGTVDGNGQSGIYLVTSDNNEIYNNIFNNSINVNGSGTNIWNTTNTSGTNIIGGSFLGGNYWAKPDGTGFSQLCGDKNGDGFCDETFTVLAGNIDYLPLTYPDTNEPSVVVNYPVNGTIYNRNVTYINVSVIDDRIIDQVIAQIDGTTNVTLVKVGNYYYVNDTVNLGNGTHSIRIFANDTSGNMNSSVYSNFTILIGAILDCGEIINSTGYYYLIGDISNSPRNVCIDVTTSDVVIDGKGYTIGGLLSTNTYGIRVTNSSAGLTNITVKNISVQKWYSGIYLNRTSGFNISNVTVQFANTGIRLEHSDNGTLSNMTIRDVYSRGIEFEFTNNSTLEYTDISKTTTTWSPIGIWLNSSNNNRINNTAISSLNYGATFSYSSGNVMTNVSINDSWTGVRISDSDFTEILNSKIFDNSYGIQFSGGPSWGTIADSTVQENGYFDIYYELWGLSPSVCTNSIVNVTGSGGRPIGYFNSSVTLNNKEFSELILCNADQSSLTNITVMGSNTADNNLIYLLYTDDSIFDGINSSENNYGLLMHYSDNNTISNSTFSNNTRTGLQLTTNDHRNRILYSDIMNNGYYGIEFDWDNSKYNVISYNNISYNSREGLYFDSDDYDYTEITYNTIERNGRDGIEFDDDLNDYIKIIGNRIGNNSGDGIYFDDDTDNSIIADNIISGNGNDGIDIDSQTDNVTVRNNTVTFNGDRGIENTGDKNTIINNTVRGNRDGIYSGGQTADIQDNTIEDNTGYGIHLYYSYSDHLSENYYSNNTVDLRITNSPSADIIKENFEKTHVSVISSQGTIDIKSASKPAVMPSGYMNVGNYFINITSPVTNSRIYINMHYTNADVIGLDEGTVRVWEFSGGKWSQVSGTNGVSTANNYGYANITRFSIFSLFAQKAKPKPSGGYVGGGGGYWINTTPTPTPTPEVTPAVTPTPKPTEIPEPEITHSPEPAKTPEVTKTPKITPTPEITKTIEAGKGEIPVFEIVLIILGILVALGLIMRRQ